MGQTQGADYQQHSGNVTDALQISVCTTFTWNILPFFIKLCQIKTFLPFNLRENPKEILAKAKRKLFKAQIWTAGRSLSSRGLLLKRF